MKIKKRLSLYYLLIILLVVFSIMTIFSYVRIAVEKQFYTLDYLAVEENANTIKEMVHDFNDFTIDEYNNLKHNLEPYGYKLFIFHNNTLTFGNDDEEPTIIDTILANSNNLTETPKLIHTERSTAIVKKVDDKLLIATYEMEMEVFFGSRRSQLQIFVLEFIMVSIFIVLFIIFVASVFSRIILSQIYKPINLLTKGAKRIKSGDLNHSIKYDKQDEFEIVINNFNEMQNALVAEKQKIKKFEDAKIEMINGISHDIRTPLTSVKGYIKGITDGVANTEEKQIQYLNIAYSKTLDIEDLLNKLFDTFNLETEIIKVNPKPTNIKDFIDDYIEKHQDEYNQKEIKIKVNTPSSPLLVSLDCKQMERVLNNLFENAMKYAKVDKLEIELNIWRENSKIHVSFKDNGQGMNEENLELAFNEFWQADKSRTTAAGRGLGLFIIKTIITAHNGTINISNKKGLLIEMLFEEVTENE